jgi:hypothetical protein
MVLNLKLQEFGFNTVSQNTESMLKSIFLYLQIQNDVVFIGHSVTGSTEKTFSRCIRYL